MLDLFTKVLFGVAVVGFSVAVYYTIKTELLWRDIERMRGERE